MSGQPTNGDQPMNANQAPSSQQLGADGQALLEAALQGDAARVRALLASGLDPNTARQPGTPWSALHLAAAGGHVSTIIALLAAGAAVDDKSAVTPLRLAVLGKHLPAVQVLLGAGAKVIAKGLQARPRASNLVTALAGAGFGVGQRAVGRVLKAGDFHTLQLLLQLGVPPGEECGRALVAAAGEGRLATVDGLLKAGVPADYAVYDPVWDNEEPWGEEAMEEFEDEPRTALIAAAERGHTDVMRCLLAAGADVETRWWTWYKDLGDPAHFTALELCSTAEAARVLLEAGAAVEDPDRDYFPLVTQVQQMNEDVVFVLLEAGADPNSEGSLGHTALQYAAKKDLDVAAAYLLAAGADVNLNCTYGGSALHEARSSEMALTLLTAGANIHAVTGSGRTPLACAAEYGRVGVIEVLLAAGASVVATDKHGCTALHAATEVAYKYGYDELAIAEKRSNSGNRGRIVELLCAAGADVSATNKAGKTPLAWAVDQGAKSVVADLIAAGAAPHTELLTEALTRPGLRGSWLTALLPSPSVTTDQLRQWAGAAFHRRPDVKQAMFGCVWALRRHLPTELLHLIAAMRCMLE